MVYGSVRGLRVIVCMTAPLTANTTPTSIDATVRGTLCSMTM